MAEFDLSDLEKISRESEIIDFLVDKGIIKEKKFLKQLAYEKELAELQSELVRLQAFVIENKKRVLVIFEGRDAAGKGGTIKRIVANLNPKRVRVVALNKPTELEQSQWYFQRYIAHLPAAGEIVFFDRSWYNRAVVEPVFGFCTPEQHEPFMKEVNEVEERLVNDGIVLIKFFLDISKDEQKERLDERKDDELKRWKVGDLDQQAQELWDVYSGYIEKMLEETSTPSLPWVQLLTDDKKTARLQSIKYLLTYVKGYEPKMKIEVDPEIVKIFE